MKKFYKRWIWNIFPVERYVCLTTTLVEENFPNETRIQAVFWPKSPRNIKEVLCNLSLVSGSAFIANQGQKVGKRDKNRVDVTIALHNSVKEIILKCLWLSMKKELPLCSIHDLEVVVSVNFVVF